MSIRLFNLRDVPDDEAGDIRELLSGHAIDFYETPAGNWGISSPSLWLNDKSQLAAAKALIDSYQQQRSIAARAEYEQLKNTGKHRTLIDEVKENPLRVVAYLIVALVVLYFSIKPFISFGR